MRVILPLLALSLATPAASQEPPLTIDQRVQLRCAVAFALTAELQQQGDAAAATLPDLGATGREYFVRAMARLMDERRWSREQVRQAAVAEARAMREQDETLVAARSCLTLTGFAEPA